MASSASGQDEPNRAMWLATRARKMEPSCPLGTTRCIPQEKLHRKPYNRSFIDQVCSVKMAVYRPRSFFASLWTSTSSRSINTQKKNSANIQPSWPHTWSRTHTYRSRDKQNKLKETRDKSLSLWGLLTNANLHCFWVLSFTFLYIDYQIVLLLFSVFSAMVIFRNKWRLCETLEKPFAQISLVAKQNWFLPFLREGGCSNPPSPSKPLTGPYAYGSYSRSLLLIPMASTNVSGEWIYWPTYATI